MKQLFLILSLIFATAILAGAQSKSDKMYNEFDGKDGVMNFSFSKNPKFSKKVSKNRLMC